MGSEIRWAWRAVRARGWQAVLVVVLLGVAIGANTILFSAADAFVFRRAPYPDAESLVVLFRQDSRSTTADYISAASVREWRRQPDLLSAVHAHLQGGGAYLTIGGITEPIPSERVTPGLFEILGGLPRWGRPLVPDDARTGAPPVVVIAEEIAAQLFNDPASAIGQRLPSTTKPEIVGVMPRTFRFPSARQRIWSPLDLNALQQGFNVRNIARLAPALSLETARAGVEQRGPAIDNITERRNIGGRIVVIPRKPLTLKALSETRGNDRYSRVFMALVAAALCLLLIACANVASLELAAAIRMSRSVAVKAALGAGRWTLIRARALEAGLLLTASLMTAGLVAWWGIRTLTTSLPPVMAQQLSNAIDFDERAVMFMIAAGSAAWIVTSLPGIIRISRGNLIDTLRDDARVMPVSRSAARARDLLVIGQVAATVLLVIGALLYARTYAARMGLGKGFDTTNLVTLEVLPAPDAPLRGQPLIDEITGILSSHPAVQAHARTSTLLPSMVGGVTAKLKIDGKPQGERPIKLAVYPVAPAYFATMGIPLVAGRLFESHETAASVIIDEAFARRFWPSGNAVGSVFDMQGSGFDGASQFTVVGVSRAVRPDSALTESGEEQFVVHYPIRGRERGAFVARLRDPAAFGALVSVIRNRAARSFVRADFLDDRYARLEGDRRLAASATGGLSALALVIAAMGIYAVMAFIVSARTREIGIRLALGAEQSDIRRSVLLSSLRVTASGALLGLAAAFAASRWLESQMYGVSPTDAATYAGSAAGVLLIAAAATWYPARQAARVDPAITLRSQ